MNSISKLAEKKKVNELESNCIAYSEETIGEAISNDIDNALEKRGKNMSDKYNEAEKLINERKKFILKKIDELVEAEKALEQTLDRVTKKIKKASSESMQHADKISRAWDGDYSELFGNLSEMAELMSVFERFVQNEKAMEFLKGFRE